MAEHFPEEGLAKIYKKQNHQNHDGNGVLQ
jgi:hypothetical protein